VIQDNFLLNKVFTILDNFFLISRICLWFLQKELAKNKKNLSNPVFTWSITDDGMYPLSGTYFNCIMFMVASSVVTTIMILNYHHRLADTHEMPEWVGFPLKGTVSRDM
jgi:hypothetical protein